MSAEILAERFDAHDDLDTVYLGPLRCFRQNQCGNGRIGDIAQLTCVLMENVVMVAGIGVEIGTS